MRLLGLLVLASGCVTFTPAPACDAGTSCAEWVCECGKGTAPARACTSGRCAEAAAVCRGACADAGTCWQGRATGGWVNGNSVGQTVCMGQQPTAGCGDRDFPDLGKPCVALSDCASGVCIGTTGSFICTKGCSSNGQCPAGWVCSLNAQGGRTCFIGALQDEGSAVSANAECKQVGFTDIGMTCQFGTDCQSGICFGTSAAGFVCSRRCNDDSLCATGFKCVSSSQAQARFCEKQ